MNHVKDNIKNTVNKGEEIFKINGKKTFYIPNKITNHRNNLAKAKIKKIVKGRKAEINIRNNFFKLNVEEVTKNIQRRTFIETNKTNKKSLLNNYMTKIIQNRRNYIFHSFINPNSNTINNNYFNKSKLFINNNKNYNNNNNFLTISSFNNIIKKNSTTFITKRKKNSENLINNQLKKRKDVIESYINKKKINQNKNIYSENFGISKIIPKKRNINKLSYTKTNILNDKITILKIEKKEEKKKDEKKEKKEKIEDDNYILDIESEHINSINKLKIENYDINKPHEYKMKFSLLNEYNDEKNNPNDNNRAEKIIIGNIEGYKDIIESDKINSNKINKQNKIKNKLIKQTEKNEKENNNLKNLEGFSIFEENSSEFYDLNLLNNNYCKTNQNLENIDNEYEFEDLSTHEYENKINKNKLILFNIEKAK